MSKNKIKGLIYGSILGDIIGVPYKGKDQGSGQETKYQDVEMSVKDWTSISERTIMLLEIISSSKNGNINIFAAAEKLCEWHNNGIVELPPRTDRHISMNLNFVLKQNDYLENPIKSSKKSYKLMDCGSAPNDAFVNVFIFGIFNTWYKNTILYTMITTYDSRCIVAGLTFAFIINSIINGQLINWNNLTPICQKIIVSQKIKKSHNLIEYNNFLSVALNYKNFLTNYQNKQNKQNYFHDRDKNIETIDSAFLVFLKTLHIGNYNENDNQSYVLQGMILAIITAIDIQDSLSKKEVINEEYFMRRIKETASCGGDSTTNCIIVGSIVGIFLGFDKLPEQWIKKINYKSWLDSKVDTFISNIKFI